MQREAFPSVAAVVAEYNPFHLGHLWQLQEIKRRGCTYVIAVMSGDFVQRGEPALLSKYERARMALLGGADLVLELPLASAIGSAPYFASGAMSLITSLGVVTHLYFGSESCRGEELSSLSDKLLTEDKEYRGELKKALKEGLSFPAAREKALRALGAGEGELKLLSSPNDTLALEYVLALRRLEGEKGIGEKGLEEKEEGGRITICPLPRRGRGHHGEELREEADGIEEGAQEGKGKEKIEETNYRSAGEIRRLLLSGDGWEEARWALPKSSWDILLKNQKELLSWRDFSLLLFDRLLLSTKESLGEYKEIGEDLGQRILRCRGDYSGMPDFIGELKSKELTYTRISRCLLHLLLGLKSPSGECSYLRLLGFRRSASPLLSLIKERASLPLVSKPASSLELRADELSLYSCNLYEACAREKGDRPFVHELKRSPIIV